MQPVLMSPVPDPVSGLLLPVSDLESALGLVLAPDSVLVLAPDSVSVPDSGLYLLSP